MTDIKKQAQKTNASNKNKQKAGNKTLSSTHFVLESREWFRNQYKNMLYVLLITLILLCLSLLFNVIQFMSKPETKYFATNENMRVVELTPLNESLVTDSGLQNWTAQAISEMFSYDFNNFRENFTDAREYLSEDGYKKLLKSVQDSGNLEMVREERLVSIAGVDPSRVVIVNRGVLKGRMTWKVEAPLSITYESSKGVEHTQELIGTILVQRTSEINNPRGIQIIQMVFS